IHVSACLNKNTTSDSRILFFGVNFINNNDTIIQDEISIVFSALYFINYPPLINSFYFLELINSNNGSLTSIPGSTHSLSTLNAQPAQVLFTPDGSKIVVSELTSNHLSVFHVNKMVVLQDQSLMILTVKDHWALIFY